MTGVSSLQTELVAKRLEVLKTLAPAVRRVWLIYYGVDLSTTPMIDKALEAAQRMKLELVPKGVLDAGELRRVLRRGPARRRGARAGRLEPGPRHRDHRAVARLASPGRLRDGALGRLWRAHLLRARLLRAGRPGRRAGRQDLAGRPASGPARRRRREDRSRREPQDRRAARPHRAAQDPASAPTPSGDDAPDLARPALPQVRRRPPRPGRWRADGVEPRRALLRLPGDAARDRPGRAREGGGRGRPHRAVPERGRAAGARDDPDRVRRSRREPGGTGEARDFGRDWERRWRSSASSISSGSFATSPPSASSAISTSPARSSFVSRAWTRTSSEARRTSPGRPSSSRRERGKTYWSPVYFKNESEPYVTLAVPVRQVRRRGDHGGGQPRGRAEDRRPDRGRRGRIRLRGRFPRPSGRPSGQSACCERGGISPPSSR